MHRIIQYIIHPFVYGFSAIKPKQRRRLIACSALAVYNAIIVFYSAFVNYFFATSEVFINFCHFKRKKQCVFYKIVYFADIFSYIIP